MKTLKGWRESGVRSFDEYCKQGDRVGECLYWYFMDILPPIYVSGGFMVSEPYSYNAKYDQETFATFIESGGKYYYLGNICRAEFKQVKSEVLT